MAGRKEKRPRGQPKIELTDDDIARIGFLKEVGWPLERIAWLINIAPATLDRIISANPKISEAIEKARSVTSARIVKTAFDMASSGISPAMTIFWLKTRERWKEAPRTVELSGVDGAPIKHEEQLSREQIKRMAMATLKSIEMEEEEEGE